MAIRRSSLGAAAILPVGGPAGLPGQPGKGGANGKDSPFQSINGYTGANPTLDDIGAAAKADLLGKLDVASDGSIAPTKATVTSGTITPQQIYGAAYPNISDLDGGFTDTNVGVRYIPPNQTLGNNVTAIAGYVWNESTTGRQAVNAGNGVALFGVGVGNSDQANLWGVNTLLTDNHTREVSSWAQQILTGAELDFNITSPHTEVIGVSAGGNCLVQPTVSNAFLANSLGHLPDGTPIRWGTGFGTFAGTANIAFAAAPLNEGPNSPSQPIWLQSTDASGNNIITSLRSVVGFMLLEGASSGFKVSAAPILLDGGEPLIIGGVAVVGDRKTGWTTGTGTPNRGAFNADVTQTIASTYSQAQVQALQDQVVKLSQRVLALETDLRAHGLIGN